MSGSPERLDKLSAKQRAAYELLLRRRQDEAAGRRRVTPAGRETDSFPLSFAQQRLWFLSELHPDSPVYHIPASVQVRGPLDAAALGRCLREVVRRHESLRTSFRVTDGQPEQVVEEAWGAELPLVDLSALPEARREEVARRLVAEDYARPFSLRRGRLWRASLLRLGPAEHVLSLTMHHIISDDWSVTVLGGELGALYEAFTRGEASPLAGLPVQYADYAQWQRRWLRGEELERQFEYWSRQLAGGPAPLQLPTDRPRPAVQSFRGGACPVRVPRESADALRRVCQEEGCTLFMGLLAAFQALLHRYTNQDEVVVGSPIANRTGEEVEGLIGFFVNTLVLSTDLSRDPTFRELLGRVREVCMGAYEHQDLPFEQMVERFQPDRDLGRTPLFQVALVLQNVPKPVHEGGAAAPPERGLSWSAYGVERGTSKFDLTLNLQEWRDGLEGVLEYNSDIFEEASIGRLARHFAALLEAAVREPERNVWSLPLLAPEERRQLIGAERAAPRRADECLHRLFEAQAAARPDSIAVSFDGEQVTYAELNRRANRLAHTLRARGVGPESLVGICLEPSVEMVAAILGVLKAGGAYLPLDPSYPRERLAYMLEDARTSSVVTRPAQAGVLPPAGFDLLCLERDAADIERAGDENPAGGAEPDNLAYVIYTSGSTGRPKGVEVTHRNVSRLLSATERWFDFGPADVWTLFHSYAFDFSVWEVWGSLAYGGRLVVVPFWVTRTPEAMRELIEAEGVTVLNQTPSAFKQLMAADEGRAETSLRYIIFGGEALEPRSLRGWFERHGDERPQLVNMYGITETTVHVTYRRVRESDAAAGDGSPVGVTIEDLKIYLLDREQNLAPSGVVGEMYVAGEGLARGYRGRGALTAARFIPDAFSAEPGARLYRSGDLARYRADGSLEYLGRADHQVKVRGFRIELGEIESALAAQPEVKEAAVLARAGADGDARLTAFVVMREGGDVHALRGRLAEWLPGHMLPASFVRVESLPLTPNGKLDGRALLAAEVEQPETGESYAPPRTPVEEVLAGVWSEVLGVERVGIDDNYFALGGDSIRSIHLRSLARARGLDVTLQQVFQHQTIRDLARVARLGTAESEESPHTPAFGLLTDEDRARLPAGLGDAYPLALLQAGMLFHGEYDNAADVYHNVGSFHLRAPFGEAALREAVRRVMARHAVLRTSFDLHTYGEPLQLVHAEVEPPLTVEDLRGLDPEEQRSRLEMFQAEERARHFDWERPPLLRFAVHRLTDDTFQFTLTEHHAILDGWSVASLLTELFKTYFSLLGVGSSPAEEPPPAVSYGDFVALERAALDSHESRDFWLSRLSDSVPAVLPRPGGDAAAQAKLIRVFEVPIAPETSEGLRRLALRNAVPVKSVLLAAHLRVLALVGGQPDVISGVVANGRPEEDGGERVLGLFLNAVPFRLKLRGGTWAELARQTYEAEVELLPHRRYPLAEIQRARGGRPLFEVAFNYTHFHVYDGLRDFEEVELLGTDGVAATNFTLGANFGVSLNNSQVRLALHCDVGAVGAQCAEQMAGYYQRALAAMARDPEGRYETADLLSDEEAGLLLREVNDTRRERPHELALHQLFEAQARRAPAAAAVALGDESITYGELDARADELARRLRALGLGPESCVGICAEPCVEMVVGLLGILKAGSAYVPLEPRYPRERISFVLEDARVSVVLARASLAEKFAAPGVTVVSLDHAHAADEQSEPAREAADVSARAAVSPDNVAYVIHTSGSTGTPKGVMVSHRSLVNHALSVIEAYGLDARHRVLQFIALNFDAAAEEIFPALACGATVVLHPNPTGVTPSELLEYCARTGVNALHLPAAYWYQMEDELELAGRTLSEAVRLVVVGGDSPSHEKMSRWAALAPGNPRFFNAYGPTEATITCTAEESDYSRADSDEEGGRDAQYGAVRKLPIGRPLGNVQAYVLDGFLRPMPAWVAGELFLGGPGVARGYLNRPDLTAEKFIPHPFTATPGERLYRTGDTARFLSDGRIEFLGRVDRQVKLRGFRIELGEVEQALRRHTSVRDAYVDVVGEGEARRLAAYVVAQPEASNEAANEVLPGEFARELRAHLQQRLPGYMVPSAFAVLDSLPLNANGKVERALLPEAAPAGGDAEEEFVAPRTPAEEIIAAACAQVLGLERLSVHSDFFALGGHSLAATRVVSQLRKSFGVEVPLRAIFESPSVAKLAETVEALLIMEIENLSGAAVATPPEPLAAAPG
ncbi:MAG TPA: amino acid adenylation domain-containing protein [Pyrinomonadaceae bacterium]